jgi:hypothetical protein
LRRGKLPRRHPELTLPRSKAPEGWRSPRRFAFAGPLEFPPGFGLRQPSAAFARFHRAIRVHPWLEIQTPIAPIGHLIAARLVVSPSSKAMQPAAKGIRGSVK